MAKQTINIGTSANDGTGSNLRAGGTIINANFTELYTALGTGSAITLTATPTELNLLTGATAIVTNNNTVSLTNKNLNSATNTFPTISIRDDASSAISISLGGTLKLKSNDGITTTVSQGDTITIGLDSNIVTETSTDTLTNKTLTLPVISTISNSGTITLPTGTRTLVARDTTDTLTNKSIAAGTNTISGLTNTNLSGSAGITNANLANSFIRITDETSTVGTVNLGDRLDFLTGNGIDTVVVGNTVRISTSAIPNASLSNSSVSIGTSTITLGAAATTSIANLNLTGTSALSGTGTIDITGSGNKIRFNFANTGAFPNATTYQGLFAVATGTAKAYFADSGAYNEIITENSSIKDLSDVAATSPTNGQVLIFNSTSGRYEPGTTGGVGTVTSIIAGTGLSGGTITSSGTISITNPNVKFSDDTSTVATINLGDTLKIAGGTGLNSTISGSVVTLDIDSTVATLTGSQTLTNKTLTTPTISSIVNSGTLTLPSSTDTLVGRATTDTLTSKTINSTNNTISNIKAGDKIASGISETAATIDVTASGASAYLFNSHYSGNNPTLYLRAGHTYAFNLQQGGSHPFFLQTVSGGYSAGNAYSTGLTHVTTTGTVSTGAVGAQSSGVLYIEVPSSTSSTIFYVCQNHSSMAGKIVLGSITDTFTGDGSTTTQTINSGRNVNDVLVIVNGIILVPTTDYTISTTTLTFSTAPAASAEIQVRYL